MIGKLREQGITLIALVVTIIILLILAGIAINLALGDNGLIARTKQAEEKYEIESLKEEIMLAKVDKEMELSRELNESEILALLEQYGNLSINEDGTMKFKPNDSSYEIPYEEMMDKLGVENSNNIVTITFDSNDGNGNMDKMYVAAGQSINLTKNLFTKEHAGFGKWNTDKTGNGTSYLDGDVITVSEDTTLYAMWADYGTELQSKYDNIYTSYDSGNPISDKGLYDGDCAGNYDKLYSLVGKMQKGESLLNVTNAVGNHKDWNIVKSGNNENRFIDSVKMKWVCLEFCTAYNSSGEISELKLEFKDGKLLYLNEAVTSGYIEPLVLTESGCSKIDGQFTGSKWLQFYNMLSGGTSGVGSYTRGWTIFKVGNKSDLTKVSFNASKDWETNNDGFSAYSIEGEISISPF